MAKIGLRPYLLEIYDTNEHELVEQNASFDGPSLSDLLPKFENFFSNGNVARTQDRALHLNAFEKDGRSFHGLISYGSFGIDSTISDTDGEELFQRTSEHIETFPLYYRVWVPKKGSAAIALLQSYESRSCTSQFLNLLRDFFEDNYDGYRLVAKKVMPSPGESLAKSEVKKVKFYKRRISPDKVKNISLGQADYFHLELIMHARRCGSFGKLKDMVSSIGDGALVYEGIEFESASAEVDMGGEKRKVGLINASNSAGVIDISDQVDLADGHPDRDSISREAKKIIRGLRKEYGI